MVSTRDVPFRTERSPLRVESGFVCMQGTERENNEDSCYVDDGDRFFVVADGMGGHNAGQVASCIACRSLREDVEESLDHQDWLSTEDTSRWSLDDDAVPCGGELFPPAETASIHEEDVRHQLDTAFRDAHEAIQSQQRENVELCGMGTTACVAIVDGTNLHVAHVGDSRVLLVTGNRARCLTRDHSMVEALLQSGAITEAKAVGHPYRNVLWKCLGGRGEQEDIAAPDFGTFNLRSGDRIVLATDGVTDHIEPGRIAEIVNGFADPDHAAAEIASAAVANGSTDDATCVVVFVEFNES